MYFFFLTAAPIVFDPLRDLPPEDLSGALTSFVGLVRSRHEGREVLGLEYEAYEELARNEGNAILREALERYGCRRLWAAHRTGYLRVGEVAVAIHVWTGHRAEGFEACRYCIDQIKQRLPVWKREHHPDGSSAWLSDPRAFPESRVLP